MRRWACTVIGAAAFALAVTVSAQQPIVYPAKGQSAQQQKKDQQECRAWATDTTGIDPNAVANAHPPQTEDQLLLHGIELGMAWTLALDQADGSLSATRVGRDGAFVLFGSCTPL